MSNIRSGGQPASYPMVNRASNPEVKWLGHEADHLPAPSDEVNNECSSTSTPPTFLHGMYKGILTSPVNNTHLHSHSTVHSANTQIKYNLHKMTTTCFQKILFQDGIKIFYSLPSSRKRTIKGRENFKIWLNILKYTIFLWRWWILHS
jgi:hypothetical protein